MSIKACVPLVVNEETKPLYFPDALRKSADPQLLHRLQGGDPIMGFEPVKKVSILPPHFSSWWPIHA